MARTAGSYLNGALALNYERVCGHKGYSYDAFQVNERYKKNPAHVDSWGKHFKDYSRFRVPVHIMDEIGYEDCDWISNELGWQWWNKFQSWKVILELHLPCRTPVDHMRSNCNAEELEINCQGDLPGQIQKCMHNYERFHPSLNDSKKFPNFQLKCFNQSLLSTYVEYMGTKLQRKRVQSEFTYRPPDPPRKTKNRCLQTNETARSQINAYLTNKLDYFKFCDACLNSAQDLLKDWKP
mmetsp:Transcript_429/g.567  ORF Transcript_429/g.567 Transcript_429/m.567 type:complete len:238 (+) Transcript_429:166-879(+)